MRPSRPHLTFPSPPARRCLQTLPAPAQQPSPSPAPWKTAEAGPSTALQRIVWGRTVRAVQYRHFPAEWDKVGNRRRPGTGGWPQHRVYIHLTALQHVQTPCTHACSAWPDVTRTLHGCVASTASVGCPAPGPPQPRLPDLIIAIIMGLTASPDMPPNPGGR